MFETSSSFADYTAQADALVAQFVADAAALRELEIRCARTLAALAELDAWRYGSAASVGELGERHAMPAEQARALLGVGRAMKAMPFIEEKVRSGRITVPAAALVGEVLSEPALQRHEDDWIGWAETESTKRLRHRVMKRREEARMGDQPAVGITVFVTFQGRENFDRAREVASQKAQRALTPGETLETMADHFLDSYDPERVAPGKRRMPDTAFIALHGGRMRTVPMAVRREVHERTKGYCAIPFCPRHIFLDDAHVVPHAFGGSREADNLVLLCSFHHWEFDEGHIRIAGTTAHPRFYDKDGRDLARRFGRGFSESPPDIPPLTPLPALGSGPPNEGEREAGTKTPPDAPGPSPP